MTHSTTRLIRVSLGSAILLVAGLRWQEPSWWYAAGAVAGVLLIAIALSERSSHD